MIVRTAVLLTAGDCALLAQVLAPALRRSYERGEGVDAELVGLVEEVVAVARLWQATSAAGSPELPSVDLSDVTGHGDYVTVREAAHRLGVSDRRVRQLLDGGRLAGHKVGPVSAVTARAVQQRDSAKEV